MTVTVRAGFIPLLDAALLIVASRRGFAEDEGLHLTLSREAAWSAVRDKLATGLLDAAHYLAPAAVAASLGIGTLPVPLIVPAALSLNGNTISLSNRLHAAMGRHLEGPPGDPATTARALGRVVVERRLAGACPLVLAHVFPFSTHHYLLRTWLAAGGIDPDTDVDLVVVPPPMMAGRLGAGEIDGFCVGAPWNDLAVRTAGAVTIHRGTDFGRALPEKVLALRRAWDEETPDTTERLVRSLLRAAAWCCDPANHADLAALLAGPDLLGVDAGILSALLAGAPADGRAADPEFLRLSPDIVEPRPDHAQWILERMIESGQARDDDDARQRARAVYRPDRFASAMRRA